VPDVWKTIRAPVTADGAPVNKMKIPIVKGHDYTNIIRDLGGSNGTLYQVLDTTGDSR
jgi:hypothetical protein